MEIIGWILIIASFVIAYVGLVYPIIPSVVFLLIGYILYGVFFSFSELSIWFWVIQVFFVILIFTADTLANLASVKRFGGTKPGLYGSTIGLLVGPFVIPFVGIIVGPFLGAFLAELLISRKPVKQAFRAGVGSFVGLLTSTIVKAILFTVMIIIFIFFI
ncbi:DUF456 family protein [Chryseomicrobium sp. FSL W7-1435]|uniref:DUF456 domain-containing protein n=1 Tax=Chryseomicrobium sp. FSL W7-1435 TaxID=2921704 RepID=UPI00315A93FD